MILTALALVVSAVFLSLLLDPVGLPAATMGLEYQRLLPPNGATRQTSMDGGPTWNDVYAELKSRLGQQPYTPKHQAVAQLLRLVVDVHLHRRSATESLPSANSFRDVDPDNLIVRLAYWWLTDVAGGDERPAAERFSAAEAIMGDGQSAMTATLYNQEFTQDWLDVLRKYIRRADTAVNYVLWMDHYLVTDHYLALPVIAGRIEDLAVRLRSAGQAADSERCARLLSRSCGGLIRSDNDFGTRLLCADVLARSSVISSTVRDGARRLLDDYRTSAANSPPDTVDPNRKPMVAPGLGIWNMRNLAIGLSFGVAAASSCLIIIGASVVMIWRKIRGQPVSLESPVYGAPLRFVVLFGAAPAAGIAVVVLWTAQRHRFFSEAWLGAHLLTLVLASALMPVTLAVIGRSFGKKFAREKQVRGGSARIVVVLGLTILLLLLAAVPPSATVWSVRWIGERFREFWFGVIVVVVVWGLAVKLARAGVMSIAKSAAALWLLNVCLASIFLMVHHRADAKYQQATAVGRMDELAARLGQDWQEKYLHGLTDAHDPARTTSAPRP